MLIHACGGTKAEGTRYKREGTARIIDIKVERIDFDLIRVIADAHADRKGVSDGDRTRGRQIGVDGAGSAEGSWAKKNGE